MAKVHLMPRVIGHRRLVLDRGTGRGQKEEKEERQRTGSSLATAGMEPAGMEPKPLSPKPPKATHKWQVQELSVASQAGLPASLASTTCPHVITRAE